MNFYISARYGRREEAMEVANRLIEEGHTVTANWVWREQPDNYEVMTQAEVAELAYEDLEDIQLASAMLALSESSDSPYGRGGRHVEFGYALGLGKELYVVGPQENIFHYLGEVTVANTLDALLEYLREQ